MATSGIQHQTSQVIAKDILIAALQGEQAQLVIGSDPIKGAEQLAQAYEVIYKKVKEISG